MAWIDDKMAYDMAPQSWIINYLKMNKISDKVINFIDNREKLKSRIGSRREKFS